MFNSALEIVIKARDEASQTLGGITNKLKEMEPNFKKMAVAGTAAFGAIAAIGVTTLKAYADAQGQTVVTNKSLENSFNQLSGAALEKLKTSVGGTGDALKALRLRAEEAGKAAVKMGFDDETAANSYAKLFSVTKDVTEAQKQVALAMDLARYKNISLEDATQKIIMVHSGATKELKSLGLAIDENATAMDNISAITKQTTGTAEEFSKTMQGQMEVMKVSSDNLKESIGAALAPAIDSLKESIIPLVEKFIAWTEAHPELVKNILLIGGGVAALVAVVGTLGLILPTVITGFTLLTGPIGLVILAIAALIAITVLIIKNWDNIKLYFSQVWLGIKLIFKEAIDGIIAYFQPLIDMVNAVVNAIEKVASGIGNVAKSVGKGVSNTVKSIGSAISGKKAQGGNVSGGSTYLVGESGPELFTAPVGGSIMSNSRLSGMGGGGIIVNINGGNYLSEDAAMSMGDYIIKALQGQMRGS